MKEGEKRVCVPASRLDGGGDEGELNSLSKWAYRRMYYKLSRCFSYAPQAPIDRILLCWPSGL